MSDIHLVWNLSARGSLALAVQNSSLVVCFAADPSIGPLDDPEQRIEFFKQLHLGCGFPVDDQLAKNVLFDVSELRKVIKGKNAKRAIVWTSNCGNDHIFLRTCAWYLADLEVEIWNVLVPPRDHPLDPFKPVSIFRPENLSPLIKTAVRLSEDEQAKLRLEFETYILHQEPLRILEADGSVSFHELSYFDQNLLLHCSSNWCKAALVIHNSLVFDPRNPMGDVVLLFRLRALIANGRIEVAGDIADGMGFFEVRLPQKSK